MDEVKFVINELNKSPFNHNLNLVSYDNLKPEQRIEILFKVFNAIDPKITFESLHLTEPEEVVGTILEVLRVMKYTPPANVTPSDFRKGIILGDRYLITNILFWLLSRLPSLKKRAYLAQYLVKIELSPEVEGDHDILLVYQQYLKLIEDFKTIHTAYENLSKIIGSVYEIQNDVRAMEQEKEQISEKLVNIKRRVDEKSNPQLFSLVQVYKNEKETNEKLSKQISNLESQLYTLNQKFLNINEQLKEAQSNYKVGLSPQDLINKIEDEVKMKRSLVREVLPAEIEYLKKYIDDLEGLDLNPRMEQIYLDKICSEIRNINMEINQIVENKMMKNDPLDDKLTLFRENASAVSEKRALMSSKLNDAEEELRKLKEELDERKSGLKGDVPLKGEKLKQYIELLRNKSSEYKKKRSELLEYKNENAMLIQKLETLKSKDKELFEQIQKLEEEKGISGYFSMKEQSGIESMDDNYTDKNEIRNFIKKITEEINEKKNDLAPKIKNVRPLRQQCQDLQAEYEQKKQLYDTQAVGLQSKVNNLEQEIKKIKEDINDLESINYLIKCQIEIFDARKQVMEEELKLSKQGSTEKILIHDKFKQELKNEENKNVELKKLQKDVKDDEENKKQLKLWKDLQALLEIKRQCLQSQLQDKLQYNHNQNKTDFLVL